MALDPWHNTSDKAVLFIVDAAHQIEQNLLLDWLSASKTDLSQTNVNQTSDTANLPPKQVGHVVVPIARDPENIPTQALTISLNTTPDTLLVPIRVVWKTSLDDKNTKPRLMDLLRGNPRRPSRKRAQKILDNDASKALCIAAEPASLKALQEKLDYRLSNGLGNESLAEFVAGQAALALDVAERRLRGCRYKVPRQVAQNIQASSNYKRDIRALSETSGASEQTLRKQSLPIFKELISVPRSFWIDVLTALNRFIISLGYEKEIVVDPDRLERFRQIARNKPTALLWTHKTHVDGFTIASMLFEKDFPTPHVLGGVNMAFAGLGFLGRRSGAIFIRRSFKDNALYKVIFRHYLGYLMEKRFPLTWAFEGTRSRVGKLMPPRYGVLKYVADAAKVFNTHDINIIPVAINYDLIGDVKDYAAEQAGGVKKPESLSWFISYLRGLRQPMGRIYIDFGEPVILNEDNVLDDDLSLAKVAFQVGVEANRVSPITFPSLVSMILSGASPRALTCEELNVEISKYLSWVTDRGINITQDLADGISIDGAADCEKHLQIMVNNGVVSRYDANDNLYRIAPEQHGVASYYRNTIVHHFVNKAILEIALLQASVHPEQSLDEFWRETERLRDLFKFEFFYTPTEEFRSELQVELSRNDKHWQDKLKNAQAGDILQSLAPKVAHAALLTFVESYRVVADIFSGLDGNATLDEKNCTSLAFKNARQAYLQRRITSQASIGKLLFQNAFKLMENMKLNVSMEQDPDIIQKRQANSLSFRALAHQLERIRVLALPTDY